MEEMNARVMDNEELNEIAEVDEFSESGNAGALVAGFTGGLLGYAMICGAKRLWEIFRTKVAERKTVRMNQTNVVDTEYTENDNAENSDEESSEK